AVLRAAGARASGALASAAVRGGARRRVGQAGTASAAAAAGVAHCARLDVTVGLLRAWLAASGACARPAARSGPPVLVVTVTVSVQDARLAGPVSHRLSTLVRSMPTAVPAVPAVPCQVRFVPLALPFA
ncbi:MAG: hypothetical protein ACK4FW_13315, partial [Stenotrophomonas sp.]